MPKADPSPSALPTARPALTAAQRLAGLRAALDLIDALVLVVDPTGRIIDAGAFVAATLGVPGAGLEGACFHALLSEPHEPFRLPLETTSPWTAAMRGADGNPLTVHWQVQPAVAGSGLYALVGRVASPSGSAHWAANSDALTGLPDRRAFRHRLEEAIARAGHDPAYRFAVLFVDLDDFKPVNDRFGHRAGDTILASVGQRLRKTLRPDDLVARHGGDEFTLLLEGLHGPADARRVARRVLQLFRLPLEVVGEALRVSASIGIAMGAQGRTADALIHAADQAMYRAKRRGSGRFALAHESPSSPSVPRAGDTEAPSSRPVNKPR